MNKKLLIAAFAAAAVMAASSLQAQELTGYNESHAFYQEEAPIQSIQDGQGLAYRLAKSSDGAKLNLFVKADKSEHAIDDISADELNAIAPAAGVQLTFDFSL
ncbi:MAG TPA: hypothetical protein DEA55_04370 [Rhodospirillaceae bacterium]|nr:hypothetical protein [Rhodospirillaceae bacterium]